MKPGPPPIPFPLKKLRGNPGHQRLSREPQPAIVPNVREPPNFITGYAADEWWRIAEELHRLSLLSVLDVMPLAACCAAYARWRTAEEVLARIAANDPATNGLLIKATGGVERRNPLIKIASDAAADMIRYAGEFGLTPVARSRLAAGVHGQPPPSKFDGLLGG